METILSHRKVKNILNLLLRVPPIFLMDIICNSKYFISLDGWQLFRNFTNFIINIPVNLKANSSEWFNCNHLPSAEYSASIFLQIFGFLLAIVLFTQATNHLVSFYLAAAALGVILWSYVLNTEFLKFCSDLLMQHSSLQQELFNFNQNALQVFFYNYASQTFLALVFCFSTMNLPYFTHKKFLIAVLFIFPTLINAALPSTVFTVTPILVSIVTYVVLIFYFLKCLPNILNFMWHYLVPFRFSFRFHSILSLIENSWTEFKITQVLQLFTIIRFVKILTCHLYEDIIIELYENKIITFKHAKHIINQTAIESFENIIAISGVATVLSFFIDKLYSLLQDFLNIPKYEQNNVSAMFSQLLILLSAKCGITSLPPVPRLVMISKICWMMYISILSRANIQINKQLIALSLTRFTLKKHSRVLIASVVMFLMSVVYLVIMLKSSAFETWLFPLVLFVIEILISLLICMTIYALNVIHYYYYTMWYEIYDYIFYLETMKSIITLFLSVLLLLTGVNKLLESGGMLRLFFIFVHFYYNIWNQLVSGWNAWKERGLISHCVKMLPIATNKEIAEMGGFCTICLNDISKHITCITRCNHFYHTYCLKKWLYERKTCPICHRIILSNSCAYARRQ